MSLCTNRMCLGVGVHTYDGSGCRRVKLSHDDLAELATVLEMLVAQGHRWSHIYTQCVLQTKLLVLQTGLVLLPEMGLTELVWRVMNEKREGNLCFDAFSSFLLALLVCRNLISSIRIKRR